MHSGHKHTNYNDKTKRLPLREHLNYTHHKSDKNITPTTYTNNTPHTHRLQRQITFKNTRYTTNISTSPNTITEQHLNTKLTTLVAPSSKHLLLPLQWHLTIHLGGQHGWSTIEPGGRTPAMIQWRGGR